MLFHFYFNDITLQYLALINVFVAILNVIAEFVFIRDSG